MDVGLKLVLVGQATAVPTFAKNTKVGHPPIVIPGSAAAPVPVLSCRVPHVSRFLRDVGFVTQPLGRNLFSPKSPNH